MITKTMQVVLEIPEYYTVADLEYELNIWFAYVDSDLLRDAVLRTVREKDQ